MEKNELIRGIRKLLRNMQEFDTKTIGIYNIMKIHNKYAFSFVSEHYDECDYIATVGEKQAISWIIEGLQKS